MHLLQPNHVPQPAPRLSNMHQARMSTGRLTESAVLKQYADLFDGSLGLLEGDVHLDTDPTVHPVQMPL